MFPSVYILNGKQIQRQIEPKYIGWLLLDACTVDTNRRTQRQQTTKWVPNITVICFQVGYCIHLHSVEQNPSVWNFLRPQPEMTCGTVAVIIRVVLFSAFFILFYFVLFCAFLAFLWLPFITINHTSYILTQDNNTFAVVEASLLGYDVV